MGIKRPLPLFTVDANCLDPLVPRPLATRTSYSDPIIQCVNTYCALPGISQHRVTRGCSFATCNRGRARTTRATWAISPLTATASPYSTDFYPSTVYPAGRRYAAEDRSHIGTCGYTYASCIGSITLSSSTTQASLARLCNEDLIVHRPPYSVSAE